MQYRPLLYAQLMVVAIIAALHLSGIAYDLYWRFLWLDVVTHTLGGVWVGLLFFHMRSLFGYVPSLMWSIAGAIAIGVAWEVFEVVAGIPREANWAFDTSIDLFMDTLGGVIGAFLARAIEKRTTLPEAMV